MRKRRLVKKEGLHSYPITSVDARPYKRRNIKVDVKPSKDLRKYQRQYHRKYRKLVKEENFI